MTEARSIYINLVRFIAALLVFLFHMGGFSGFKIPLVGDLGTEAVIVFFVLSGFVISSSAGRRHPDFLDFMLARFARLWSVVLPAILLTIFCDSLGQKLFLAAYGSLHPFSLIKWVISSVSSVLFISQLWNLDIWLGSNGPYWSICYEFWYYLIFAFAFYPGAGRRGPANVLLPVVAGVIAGPKIMIPFPIWLFGVALSYVLSRNSLTTSFRRTAWLCSVALVAGYALADITGDLKKIFPGTWAMADRQWSIDFWPKSYLIGIFIVLNIFGFDPPARLAGAMSSCKHVIQILADSSFGLYLFHYPIGYFVKASLSAAGLKSGAIFALIVYLGSFLLSFSLALLCDPLRRPLLRQLKVAARAVSDAHLQLKWGRKLGAAD